MSPEQKILDHGSYGFVIALPSVAMVQKFNKVIPLTDDAEISAITFPPAQIQPSITYHGDTGIIGVPLVKGAVYAISGNSITMAAGHKAMLILSDAFAE